MHFFKLCVEKMCRALKAMSDIAVPAVNYSRAIAMGRRGNKAPTINPSGGTAGAVAGLGVKQAHSELHRDMEVLLCIILRCSPFTAAQNSSYYSSHFVPGGLPPFRADVTINLWVIKRFRI